MVRKYIPLIDLSSGGQRIMHASIIGSLTLEFRFILLFRTGNTEHAGARMTAAETTGDQNGAAITVHVFEAAHR
jgi:hypothetical protein